MKNITKVISLILCMVMMFSMSVFAKKPDVPETLVEEMLQNVGSRDLYKFGSISNDVNTLELVLYYGEVGGYHIGVFFPKERGFFPMIGEVIIGNYRFQFSNLNYGENLFAYKDGEFIFNSEIDFSELLSEDELKQLADVAGASLVDSAEDEFIDVNYDAWYGNAVVYCVENGIMSGMGNAKFAPAGKLTREQLMQVFFAMEGLDKADYEGETGFVDVSEGRWYSPAVKWAKAEGITNGIKEDTFGIGQYVTREQLATFIMNYVKYKNGDITSNTDLTRFSDADKVSAWAVEGIEFCVEKGIINGRANGTLDPRTPANRAELAQILKQFLTMA